MPQKILRFFDRESKRVTEAAFILSGPGIFADLLSRFRDRLLAARLPLCGAGIFAGGGSADDSFVKNSFVFTSVAGPIQPGFLRGAVFPALLRLRAFASALQSRNNFRNFVLGTGFWASRHRLGRGFGRGIASLGPAPHRFFARIYALAPFPENFQGGNLFAEALPAAHARAFFEPARAHRDNRAPVHARRGGGRGFQFRAKPSVGSSLGDWPFLRGGRFPDAFHLVRPKPEK